MPYTLKGTGQAADLAFLLMVDEGGTTNSDLKEFVSGTVDANKTVHANVTVGNTSWLGQDLQYFAVGRSGNYTAHNVKFPSGFRPAFDFGDGGSCIALFNLFTDARASNRMVVGLSTTHGWTLNSSAVQSFTPGTIDPGATPFPTSGKFAAAFNFDSNNTHEFYFGLEASGVDALALDNTPANPGNYGGVTDIAEIGGFDGQGAMTAQLILVAGFDSLRTLTQLREIFNDPLGTFFEPLSGGDLTTEGALHGHISSAPTLTQAGVLSVDGSLHGHVAGSVTLDVAAVIQTSAMKNNTGTVLAGETGITVDIYNPATGALVVRRTSQTSNGAGRITITDALLAPATTYVVVVRLASGAIGIEELTAT